MEHEEGKLMKDEYEGFEEFDGFLHLDISEEEWI